MVGCECQAPPSGNGAGVALEHGNQRRTGFAVFLYCDSCESAAIRCRLFVDSGSENAC
jgi:hypothetical protein